MGRPSLQLERQEQILDAFEQCVIEHGIEGATLQKIAEHCGLARPLVRHHAGNRDELIQALKLRVIERTRLCLEELVQSLPDDKPATGLVDCLFEFGTDEFHDVLLAEALISAARHDAQLASDMAVWIDDFVESVGRQCHREFRHADANDVRTVSTGIAAIYFNASSLLPLPNNEAFSKRSKTAALGLLGTLRT